MQPTPEQLKKVSEIAKLANEWLVNFKNHSLQDDPEMVKAFPVVKQAFDKSKAILVKSQSAPVATQAQAEDKPQKSEGIFDTLSSISKIKDAWNNSQLISALSGGFSIDNAKNIVREANDFIALVQSVIDGVKNIPVANQIVPTAQEYLNKAKKVLEYATAAAKVLDVFKNVSSIWDTIKDLVSGKTSPDTGVIGKVQAFVKSAKDFINAAKNVPSASDKFAAVQGWLNSAEGLLKNFGGLLEDKDGNGLPDWYDKIKATVNGFLSQTSLIPGTTVDDKILAKAREIQAEIEKWLKAAVALGGKVGKIADMLKDLQNTVATIKKFIAGAEKAINAIKNGDWAGLFDQFAGAYRDFDKLTGFIPGTDIDDKLIAKAKELKAKLEDWLTKTTGMGGDLIDKINEAKKMFDKVKGFVDGVGKFADAVKNKDWKTVYEMIKAAYRDIEKLTGFIPGTDIDDKIIAKIQALKKQMEDFVRDTLGLEGDIFDMIEEVQGLLKKVRTFIDGVKKFVDAIKNKDWKTVYEMIKSAYQNIDKLTGFIPGTDIDDKIIAQVQKLKGQMEEFIRNTIGGDGDIFAMYEEISGLMKNVRGFFDGAKKFIDAAKNGDWNTVFEQIKKTWETLSKTNDFLKFTNLDDKVLAKVHEFQKTIEGFLEKVTGKSDFASQIEQVKSWAATVTKIINFGKGIVEDVKNGDYVSLFNKIVTAWTDLKGIDTILGGTIDQALFDKIHAIQKDVEAFISKATGGILEGDLANMLKQVQDYKAKIDGVIGFAKALKGDIENKDFGSAIKRILTAWTDLNKLTNGFIPGTNIDDKLIGKSQEVKKMIEDFLSKYTGGALSGDLLNMYKQVQDYYKIITGFVDGAVALYKDIKSGNWSGVYDRLKGLWEEIEKKKGDLIPGTTLDEELYKKAEQLKDMATSWLVGFVQGDNDADKKKTVQAWLADSLKLVGLFMSKKPILDFTDEFKDDKEKIDVPALEQLSDAEENSLLNEISGGMTQGGLRGQLAKGLNKIALEVKGISQAVDKAYKEALQRNINSVDVIKKAKLDYNSVITEQKRVVAIVQTLSRVVISVVTSVLLSPAAAVAVNAGLSALKGDFKALGDMAGKLLGTGNEMVDGLISAGIGMATGVLSNKGGEAALNVGDAEIQNAFRNQITNKYEEVQQLVSDMQKYLIDLLTVLSQLDDTGVAKMKGGILARVKQWQGIKSQIESKYIKNTAIRATQSTAYDKLRRLMFSGWLANNKEIMLIDALIDRMNTLGIAKDSGVELSKGFGSKLARGLGSIFGGWLSFGEDKKIKALAVFGAKDVVALSTPGSWKDVL